MVQSKNDSWTAQYDPLGRRIATKFEDASHGVGEQTFAYDPQSEFGQLARTDSGKVEWLYPDALGFAAIQDEQTGEVVGLVKNLHDILILD